MNTKILPLDADPATLLIPPGADKDTRSRTPTPGGGLAAHDASVLDCAGREVYEETGLTVQVGPLVYLREFCQRHAGVRHLELFFRGEVVSGALTIAHVKGNGPDEDYIQAVAWCSQADIQGLVVFPEHLAHGFWQDLARGFPEVQHLGVQRE